MLCRVRGGLLRRMGGYGGKDPAFDRSVYRILLSESRRVNTSFFLSDFLLRHEVAHSLVRRRIHLLNRVYI